MLKRGVLIGVFLVFVLVFSTSFIAAEWTANLNDGLFAYYNFSGIEENVHGVANLIPSGTAGQFTSFGLIGGAAYNPGTVPSCYNISKAADIQFAFNTTAPMTINFWIFKNNPGFFEVLSSEAKWPPSWGLGTWNSNAAYLLFSSNNSLFGNVQTSNWTMLTAIRNTTSTCLYVNGVLGICNISRIAVDSTDPYIQILGTIGGGDSINGYIDELGFWNRSLTDEEITALYNNGNGISYIPSNESSQNETTNQSGFWNLSGTNLYPSALNYNVGIGKSDPTSALDVVGTILASEDFCIFGGICLSDFVNFSSGGNPFNQSLNTGDNPSFLYFKIDTKNISIGNAAGNNAGGGNKGDSAISIGTFSGNTNTGNNVNFMGYASGDQNKGNNLATIGSYAARRNTGNDSVFVGYSAGESNIGNYLAGVGYRAGYSNTGNYVTALGYYTGQANVGDYLTAFGGYSGFSNNASYVTSVGGFSGYYNNGIYSTLIGYQAGRYNNGGYTISIGSYAGYSNTGNNSIFIGYEAGKNNTKDNQLIIKQSTVSSTPLIQGNFSSGVVSMQAINVLLTATLPNCSASYNGTIMRNISGVYGCSTSSEWIKIF